LETAIKRLRPEGKQNLSAPEWLLYNILEMRFIQGRKVREIAERLAMSESDLYRKQRVAIGQVARVLSEMEQANGSAVGQSNDQSNGPTENVGNGIETNGRAETAAASLPTPTVTTATDAELKRAAPRQTHDAERKSIGST
jgi:hypothetical protein